MAYLLLQSVGPNGLESIVTDSDLPSSLHLSGINGILIQHHGQQAGLGKSDGGVKDIVFAPQGES